MSEDDVTLIQDAIKKGIYNVLAKNMNIVHIDDSECAMQEDEPDVEPISILMISSLKAPDIIIDTNFNKWLSHHTQNITVDIIIIFKPLCDAKSYEGFLQSVLYLLNGQSWSISNNSKSKIYLSSNFIETRPLKEERKLVFRAYVRKESYD